MEARTGGIAAGGIAAFGGLGMMGVGVARGVSAVGDPTRTPVRLSAVNDFLGATERSDSEPASRMVVTSDRGIIDVDDEFRSLVRSGEMGDVKLAAEGRLTKLGSSWVHPAPVGRGQVFAGGALALAGLAMLARAGNSGN